MTKILDVSFAEGRLPEGWIEQHRCYSFEDGTLRSNEGAILVFPVPGGLHEKLVIEVEVEAIGGAHVTCGDGLFCFLVDVVSGRHSIVQGGTAVLASARQSVEPVDGRYLLSFVFDRGKLTALANGRELVSGTDPHPRPAGGVFEFGFWHDCRVQAIRAFGEVPVAKPVFPPARRPDYHLDVCVDFFDDLLYAPWTRETFDSLFAEFQSWGVRRCHWIHYGPWADGWWENAPLKVAQNVRETMRHVGEIFPAAVQAAHAHGIEIYGLIKPWDMGLFQHGCGDGAPEAKTMGKLPRIGGPVSWIANFPAQHRQWIMARKPGVAGEAESAVFTRVDLVKEDAESVDFGVADLAVFVSDDNTTYRSYDGPIEREETVEDYAEWESTSSGGRPTGRTRSARVLRLKGLDVSSKYLVLTVAGRTGSFANDLVNLVHVFAGENEVRRLTYGFIERAGKFALTENVSAVGEDTNFRRHGIHFDVVAGVPTSLSPGYDGMAERWVIDSGPGLLAIAAGKNDGPIAAMSPAFPEVREWWLSWVRDALEAGADGIELRLRNHHSHIAWNEYGFEKPVRDEFLRRHEVDLWETDDFDRAQWSALRGEAVTEFYREVKNLCATFDKPMGVQVSTTECLGPGDTSAMNIFWNWPLWLEEGLVRSVTLKDVFPGSRLAEEILERARARGIRVIFSPYANDLWLTPGGERVCAGWIRLGEDFGCDGFQLYECACAIKGIPEGAVTVTHPALKQVLQNRFAAPGQG